MLSRLFRAGDDGTRGVDQPLRESRPLTSVKRRGGGIGNGRREERERKDHRDRGTRLFLDTGVAVSFSDAP